MRSLLRPGLLAGLTALALAAPASAQVFVRAPFVDVRVGGGVYVRAPFVRLYIPGRAPPPAYYYPPPVGYYVTPPPPSYVPSYAPAARLVSPSAPAPTPLPPPMPPSERGDPPPVPAEEHGSLPVRRAGLSTVTPAPEPEAPRAVTPGQFAAAFTPAAGNYDAWLIHPFSGKPVRVSFTLPEGKPRRVIANRFKLEFDYGRRIVTVRFFRNGEVAVRY
jgi:hypothetical protein